MCVPLRSGIPKNAHQTNLSESKLDVPIILNKQVGKKFHTFSYNNMFLDPKTCKGKHNSSPKIHLEKDLRTKATRSIMEIQFR